MDCNVGDAGSKYDWSFHPLGRFKKQQVIPGNMNSSLIFYVRMEVNVKYVVEMMLKLFVKHAYTRFLYMMQTRPCLWRSGNDA